MELKFHGTGGPIRGTKLKPELFEYKAAGGVAILFQFESPAGGFRFIHAVDGKMRVSYIVLHFPYLEAAGPTAYELSLPLFHNFCSYWLIQQQVDTGEIKLPPGKPTPFANLAYCMNELITTRGNTK